jgi:hypothetical protein
MRDYADADEPTYAELVEKARALLAAVDMPGALQSRMACVSQPAARQRILRPDGGSCETASPVTIPPTD